MQIYRKKVGTAETGYTLWQELSIKQHTPIQGGETEIVLLIGETPFNWKIQPREGQMRYTRVSLTRIEAIELIRALKEALKGIEKAPESLAFKP